LPTAVRTELTMTASRMVVSPRATQCNADELYIGCSSGQKATG
jgi:hypothetical protein